MPHLQGEGAPVEQGRAGQGGGQVRGAALQQGNDAVSILSLSFSMKSYVLLMPLYIYFQINALF